MLGEGASEVYLDGIYTFLWTRGKEKRTKATWGETIFKRSAEGTESSVIKHTIKIKELEGYTFKGALLSYFGLIRLFRI
jgi:hypothetical protein